MSFKERLCAFIFFNLLGYIIQLGSLSNLYLSIKSGEVTSFVLFYTIGNILSLIGTFIYVGVNTQLSNMTAVERRLTSIVFFSSMIFCLVYPIFDSSTFGKILTIAAVIVQMISYWIYTISFFPRLQNKLTECCGIITGRKK